MYVPHLAAASYLLINQEHKKHLTTQTYASVGLYDYYGSANTTPIYWEGISLQSEGASVGVQAA